MFVCVFVLGCVCVSMCVCAYSMHPGLHTECGDPLPSPLKGAARLLTENVSLHACTNMQRDPLPLTRTDGRVCIALGLEMYAHTPLPPVPTHLHTHIDTDAHAGCLAGYFGFGALSPVFAE